MGKFTKILVTLAFLVTLLTVSQGHPFALTLEPVDRCIYTCIHCYKDNLGLVCANECLATDSKMHPFWFRTCPQLSMNSHYMKGLELDENDIARNPPLENKLY